jgi:tetratricopeptide (TPR) repeat protein
MEILAVQAVIAIVLFTCCLCGIGAIPVILAIGATLMLVFAPWLMALQLMVIFVSSFTGAMIHQAFKGTSGSQEPPLPQKKSNIPNIELAKNALKEGKLEEARDFLILDINSGNKSRYYDLALVEEKISGRYSCQAERYFESAVNTGDHRAHYHLGLHAFNFGHHAKAKYHFHQAVEKKDPRGSLGLGKMEFERKHRWDARDHFQKAIKGGIVEAYCHLAILEDDCNNFEEAISLYKTAIEHGYKEAYNKLGVVYHIKNQIEEAKASFMQAIASGDIEGHYHLGVFYFKEGNLQEAKLEFLKAVEVNARTFDASYYLALIHYQAKEYKTALSYLDKFSFTSDPQYIKLRSKIELLSAKAS